MEHHHKSVWFARIAAGVAAAVAMTGVTWLSGVGAVAHAATVLPNVNVSRAAGNQSEGAIAIDPTNPLRLFAVSNIDTGNGLFAAHSTDSGATWTGGTIATGASGALPSACCDSSVSWDSFGNLFLTYLDSNTGNGTVHVAVSTDGGQTFSLVTNLDSGSVDQPTITTGAGSVWVTWTNGSDQISAAGARVTGLGAGHVGSFTAIEHAGDGDFGDIAIGPTGAVMVTYQRPHDTTEPSTLYTALDADGLGSGGFAAEKAVVTVNMSGFTSIPPQSGRPVDAEAGLAWDRSGGTHNGRLYFVYTDRPSTSSNDTNIFVRFSDDSGAHWSSAVRVNDDTGSNSQFLPRIALDQTSGQVAVSFHDARNSSDDTSAQVFAATSTDGTAFSANQQISAGTSNAADAHNNIDYGDYTGLAYQEGSFYPFWADNSNSTNDNPDGALHAFDMYTATVVVNRRPTNLVYTGPTSFTVGQNATLSATLTDATTGTALPGQTVTLTLGTQSCTATTDATGSAACTITVAPSSGGVSAGGSFAGTTQYGPSSTSTPVQPTPTQLTYTGPTSADFHDAFTASATLTSGGGGVSGATVSFALGAGAGTESCTATTNGSGAASCTLTPNQAAGATTLAAAFGGTSFLAPSGATVSFTITREETATAYTGPGKIANGVPAHLSGTLKEDGTVPIAGRTLAISLGSGASQQTCTGTTDASGAAACTIPLVNQPLNAAATVPVTVGFAGDAFYLPSTASATVLLEFYTGRAFGLSADINLLLLHLTVPPTPDTGPVRVAQATTTTTPCAASVNAVVITANTLCPNVTTRLAPGTSTATSTVADASVGLPGVPVIEVSGLTATSTSTCGSGGSATGSATFTLRIGGVPTTVPTAPNSEIDLPGGTRLIVDEQAPVPGADFGLTVNALHIVAAGGLADVVVGSATSDVHNCA